MAQVTESAEKTLIKAKNLVKFFPITGGVLNKVIGHVHAVNDISFDVPKGKTIGIVGESGCGKTTLGRTILRLTEPTSGDVFFENENIPRLASRSMRMLRKRMQIIFQDPYASLNPRMMVKDVLTEPLLVHARKMQKKYVWPVLFSFIFTCLFSFLAFLSNYFPALLPSYFNDFVNQKIFEIPFLPLLIVCFFFSFLFFLLLSQYLRKGPSKNQINNYVLAILREVGLDKEHLNRFPHEFSGGQRQRICIARALMLNPDFIVLDEPTASVDVSVQARVLNLLKRLQERRNLTYMFISHDLSVVTHMSDNILVMYLGKIMEIGPKNIFTLAVSKVHPYTAALGNALPIPDPEYAKIQIIIKGDVPSPVNPPPGCVFHTRCLEAQKICTTDEPEMKQKGETGHFIACHFR